LGEEKTCCFSNKSKEVLEVSEESGFFETVSWSATRFHDSNQELSQLSLPELSQNFCPLKSPKLPFTFTHKILLSSQHFQQQKNSNFFTFALI
jgi:hypothetical protein